MTGKAKDKLPIRWVRVDETGVVWPEAQRPLMERHVQAIQDGFDPDAFGIVSLAERNGSGLYHWIDGQHRCTALMRMGYGDQLIPAEIYPVHTAKEAAKLFKLKNAARKPSALDQFRVSVTAGMEPEVGITKIVKACGFYVGVNSESSRAIGAVRALQEVHRINGPEVLRDTLTMIALIWRDDPDSTTAPIIRGVAATLHEWGASIDRARLRDRVAKKYTAANLFAAAKSQQSTLGGNLAEHVATLLVHAYNQGLRGAGRLELSA